MKYTIYVTLAAALVGCLVHAASLGLETSTAVWTPNPLCPYPSEELVFHPDPYDCSKYYECFEGNLYVMSCPDNLYWNQDAQACDYLENTNCSLSPNPSEATDVTTLPTTELSPANVTATENSSTTSESPVDPGNLCANQPDGSYVANPIDCQRFYECVGGKEVEGTCPTGTAWNEEILSCDHPSNVTCS